MSGHETIRVLEVEVDASLPSSAPDGKSEGKAGEEEEEEVAGRPTEPGGLAVSQSAVGAGKSLDRWRSENTLLNVDKSQPWLCSRSAGRAAGGVRRGSTPCCPNADPCCSDQCVPATTPGRHARRCTRLSAGMTVDLNSQFKDKKPPEAGGKECNELVFYDATPGADPGKSGHSDDGDDGADRIPGAAPAHPPQHGGLNRWPGRSGCPHLADHQRSFSSRVCSRERSGKSPQAALCWPPR